jgi:hypothetical protein
MRGAQPSGIVPADPIARAQPERFLEMFDREIGLTG